MGMKISELAQELKLPHLKMNYKELIDEANHTKMDYYEFLEIFLEREYNQRKSNSIQRRLREAKFPTKKYLEDFDKTIYSPKFKKKFSELEALNFIDNKENVILVGTPGSGKTHYSIALGIKSCLQRRSVLFTSVPNLIIELKEAMSQSKLSYYKKRFERYDIVILDELGYISFDKSGSELLFNLLSNRTEKGSIIITTNLGFERWEEIFHDTTLTGAMIDRLTYKAHILDLSRDVSFRYEETLKWLKDSENGCESNDI